MIKVIIGIIITALSTFIGKKYTDRYLRRFSFFKAVGDFNSDLIRDLKFKKDGLVYALEKEYLCSDFNSFAKKYAKAIKSGDEMPELPDYLTVAEKNDLKDYFCKLGKYSATSEADYLSVMREEISKKCEELDAESKKNSKLGGKLGFILGVAVFVIII